MSKDPAAVTSREAAGVFALDFSSKQLGLVVGGDFEDPNAGTSSRADKRAGWTARGDLTHLGKGVAWLKQNHATALAVGKGGGVSGTSLTRDDATRVADRLNGSVHGVKFTVLDDESLLAMIDMPATPFVPEHLREHVHALVHLITDWDDEILPAARDRQETP